MAPTLKMMMTTKFITMSKLQSHNKFKHVDFISSPAFHFVVVKLIGSEYPSQILHILTPSEMAKVVHVMFVGNDTAQGRDKNQSLARKVTSSEGTI
jgi:hypothetical protein